MKRGWDASPVLDELLKRRGWTQERLAEAAGIGRETVNGYATGRLRMGPKNGQLIADALGVNVLELGAPEEDADEPGVTLLQRLDLRLEEAEKALNHLGPELERLVRRVAALERGTQPKKKPAATRTAGRGLR